MNKVEWMFDKMNEVWWTCRNKSFYLERAPNAISVFPPLSPFKKKSTLPSGGGIKKTAQSPAKYPIPNLKKNKNPAAWVLLPEGLLASKFSSLSLLVSKFPSCEGSSSRRREPRSSRLSRGARNSAVAASTSLESPVSASGFFLVSNLWSRKGLWWFMGFKFYKCTNLRSCVFGDVWRELFVEILGTGI